jgi:hypothetical protein
MGSSNNNNNSSSSGGDSNKRNNDPMPMRVVFLVRKPRQTDRQRHGSAHNVFVAHAVAWRTPEQCHSWGLSSGCRPSTAPVGRARRPSWPGNALSPDNGKRGHCWNAVTSDYISATVAYVMQYWAPGLSDIVVSQALATMCTGTDRTRNLQHAQTQTDNTIYHGGPSSATMLTGNSIQNNNICHVIIFNIVHKTQMLYPAVLV